MTRCTSTFPHHHARVTGSAWLEQVHERLRACGYRLTPARLDVLAWISTRDIPFSAEEAVHALGSRLGPGSRSTIYRLVQLLRDERWLARVVTERSEHAYLRQLPGHHSAICLACGLSVLIGGLDVAAAVAPSLAGSGFAIQHEELTVYGLCGGCRAA